MKTIRSSIFCLGALLLIAPMLHAQALSKYRGFSLGTSLADVLKHSGQNLRDVKVIHARPLLIQELTWRTSSTAGPSSQPDSIEQIVFSFSHGELYKISVTYNRASTEGLTAADMVKSISAKYGPATNALLEVDSARNDRHDVRQKAVAAWEDAQYSFNLVRSSYADHLGLVIYSKRVNEEAELAIAEAVKLEEQEGPKHEAERQKKQMAHPQVARQKNLHTIRP